MCRVVLLEDGVVVIDHWLGYNQLKLAALELVAHYLGVLLHLLEALDDPIDLALLLAHLSLDFSDL